MKTIIDVDERNRIELSELGGKVSYTQFFRMDSGEWVIKGGLMLTPEKAATLGECLIQEAGKDKQMLKPRYQRKDY